MSRSLRSSVSRCRNGVARPRRSVLRAPRRLAALAGLGALGTLSGCNNSPYPAGQTAQRILYRALADDPKTLDPSIAYTVTEASIIDVIYPPYFQYNYLKRDPFVLEPALGAEEPKREPYTYTVTEKGKTVQKTDGEAWTFRIKPGLRFQDDPCFLGGKGREITAKDFIYSFRRMTDPSVPCPVVSFFDDKVLGMADYEAQNQARKKQHLPMDYNVPVQGLQLDPKDPYTFRILLNQKYPQLRYLMAMHFTTPLPHEAVERYGKEFARHPVGCGAFKLTEYIPKQRITLEANPNYREEFYPAFGSPGDREAGLLNDAGKRLPQVKKVVFNVIQQPVTGWNLFLQGYQDAWTVNQTNYQQVMSQQGHLSSEMTRKGIHLYRDVTPNIEYFAFNMNDSVVGGYTPQKRKLRQAISTALDAQAFIDLFSQGNGKPAQFIIPPGIFGYDPNYKNPYRQFSVDRAKQLLAEAGYPNGIDPKTGERLTLYFDSAEAGASGRQFVGLVTKQLEAIDIRLESRESRGIVWQDKVDKGQFQFVRWGWLADYPDPENFVFLLYGPNKRPGPNAAAYNSPQYNALFEKMRSMDNGPERAKIIAQMRDIAVEDCPWIFLDHSEDLFISYNWLKNVKPHPVSLDSAKYLTVDTERRVQRQREWNRPNYWPLVGLATFLFLGSVPAINTARARTRRRARRSAEELH